MFSSNTSQVSEDANYIEQVFATHLYTGNGSTQTITNGIDLTGKGGLTWVKKRSAAEDHFLVDSARGANYLSTNTTTAQGSQSVLSLGSSGFNLLLGNSLVNASGSTYASWTFRKQPKFFDVVTYTGNDVAGRTVAHNLGSEPAVIIVKSTSDAGDWAVYHRSLGATKYILLNSTAAAVTASSYWQNTTPTSTEFTLGGAGRVNYGGRSYVAYLFAHDAGGFGLTGTDNVISCGSYTQSGGVDTVNLGYEPQWFLRKRVDGTSNWNLLDTMRGWSTDTSTDAALSANTTSAESLTDVGRPTATGMEFDAGAAGVTYIYIAIRRGPMKVPTTGTSVFSPSVSTAAVGTDITTGFPVDMQFPIGLSTITLSNAVDRLRGVSSTTTSSGLYLEQATTNAEASGTVTRNWGNTGFQFPQYFSTLRTLFLNFRRAPGFFDEVCYTGTGSARTVAHNLGVAPELMIVKCRNAAGSWWTYHVAVGNGAAVRINADSAPTVSSTFWNSTTPTDTVFSLGTHLDINGSGETNVAYLFASCPGVSKVGSYTGTGTTQQINCGFTGGARFVLIKRTDSTGAWYVWDSARGIVAGNDPYLLLNSTAAEVTSTDYIDPVSSGFEISSTAPAAINASGGTFIFLAIA